MNHLSLLPLAGALILTASVAWSANEPAAPISVEMKSISYDPKSVEVPVGGSIVWTNKAFTNHTATSEDDGKTFDTGEIKPNESSSPVKFDKEGEFTVPLQDTWQDDERNGGGEAAGGQLINQDYSLSAATQREATRCTHFQTSWRSHHESTGGACGGDCS